MSKKIIIVGGGGHCKSVLDSLLKLNEYSEIGIVDKHENVGNLIMGIPVVGCDENLPTLFKRGYKYAFVAIGSVGNPSLKIELFNIIKKIGFEIPVIVDFSAEVSNHVNIKQGVFVGKRSIINADVLISEGAIINSGSIVEHDCQIGAFSHIAPGAILGGGVIIGDNSHVGANTTIKQQVCIGANSMIGMGSVVLQNISDNTLAYGTPCREVRTI